MASGPRTRNNSSGSSYNVASFESFFDGWLARQETFLRELLSAQETCDRWRVEEINDLIKRVLAHYQQYYEEKSKIAQHNVFLLFAPTWFTSFEQTFLWVAGFKPSLVFRLVNHSVSGLSEDQRKSIARLKAVTMAEEKALDDELAKVQESAASPPIMDLARRWGRLVDGEITDGVDVLEGLKESLEVLVASADNLRAVTVAEMVDILDPVQNVKFSTAATQLQLRIREWGLLTGSSNSGSDRT